MKTYHDFLRFILENGTDKEDRTKTGTRNIFGFQMRFSLENSFPLVTTKKIHLKSNSAFAEKRADCLSNGYLLWNWM